PFYRTLVLSILLFSLLFSLPHTYTSNTYSLSLHDALPIYRRGRYRALRRLLIAATLLAFAGAHAQSNLPRDAAGLKPKSKLRLLGSEIPPGTTKRLTWSSGAAIEGFASPAPVIVLNGSGPGPVLCL